MAGITTTIWRITLFGGLQAQRREQTVTHFGTRKVAVLLAYLALFPQQSHPREVLAELIWPDEDTEATRDRFRQALSALRRALEPEDLAGRVLMADRAAVQFVPGTITTDVAEFEAGLKVARLIVSPDERAAGLERALLLYRNDLLPGYYENWLSAERRRLAELRRDALALLAEAQEQRGDLPAALDAARRALAADPLREETCAHLMRLYTGLGRRADAVRQYHELARLLQTELNTTPSSAIQALYAQLRSSVSAVTGPTSVTASAPAHTSLISLEPEGGAVPLNSYFYITRLADADFAAAIGRRDSIVLVKGARQMGKTSLLARGLQEARQAGARVTLTDLQKLTSSQMETADALFFSLAETMTEQLQLSTDLEALWSVPRSWNVKLERFLRREVLGRNADPIVWGLDETDRLFERSYRAEVFGLFRSWHNERSLDPESPWSRLTLAIAYATEAHLFITDLNQSPFNVGTRLTLDDFTPDEVAELNRRYGEPLQTASELARYYALIGGNPYLVRRGLHALVTQEMDIAAFEAAAEREDGPFADPLRRMVSALLQDEGLTEAVRGLLRGQPIPNADSFYRLRSAGLVIGGSEQDAQIRCKLYADQLRRRLQ